MTDTLAQDGIGVLTTVDQAAEALVLRSCVLGGQPAPAAVLIAPWGEVRSVNGSFVMDDEAARLVVAAYEGHGTDLPIDYEHQSLGGAYASPTGQAPAAGWIRGLRAVPPEEAEGGKAGLLAEVAWTAAAEAQLSAGEYRYLSPVVLVRKSDRRVVGLHSAALTNKPAIVGMKPIVNRVVIEPGAPIGADDVPADDADRTEVCSAAGLSAGIEVLRRRLGLASAGEPAEVLLAADQRLAALTAEAAQQAARAKVAAAMQAGRLTPAQREWAVRLALSDPAAFEEWAATAPAVVMVGRTAPPNGGVGSGGRDRAAMIASARADFRSQPDLALLTSEAAWVSDALREAGLAEEGEK